MDKMPSLEMDGEGGDLVSQLKLNYTQWQLQVKEKLDLGRFAQDPPRFKVFPGKLPAIGVLRK